MKEQLLEWIENNSREAFVGSGSWHYKEKILNPDSLVSFIESLSLEPKAESVEGLQAVINQAKEMIEKDGYSSDVWMLLDLNSTDTPSSVKPVMPEEMSMEVSDTIEALLNEAEDRFVSTIDVCQAIRTALMNSGDKDGK